MSNGSLGDFLHNGKDSTLCDWGIRCKIAIGAAQVIFKVFLNIKIYIITFKIVSFLLIYV